MCGIVCMFFEHALYACPARVQAVLKHHDSTVHSSRGEVAPNENVSVDTTRASASDFGGRRSQHDLRTGSPLLTHKRSIGQEMPVLVHDSTPSTPATVSPNAVVLTVTVPE